MTVSSYLSGPWSAVLDALADAEERDAERARMGRAIAFITPRQATAWARDALAGRHGYRAQRLAMCDYPLLSAVLAGASLGRKGVIVDHDGGDEDPAARQVHLEFYPPGRWR